jgi:hypothetical protein
LQGGFDMICSGRDKIETPEQVEMFFLMFCMARIDAFIDGLSYIQFGTFCSLSKLKRLLQRWI